MNEKEFRQYVYEQQRQGRSESQIARSLGMSLAHFMGRLNGVNVDKVDPPKQEKKTEKKKLPKPEKVAEGVYREPFENTVERIKTNNFDFGEESKEEKKAVEDLSWME